MPPDRRAQLASIHIAVKDLRLPRDQYEAMVLGISAGRTASSKDLTDGERGRLLDRFRDLGWTPVKRPGAAGPKRDGDAQARMIRGIWAELGRLGELRDPSEAGLRKWVEGETGKSDLRFCDSRDKAKLIEAAKAWRARAMARKTA